MICDGERSHTSSLGLGCTIGWKKRGTSLFFFYEYSNKVQFKCICNYKKEKKEFACGSTRKTWRLSSPSQSFWKYSRWCHGLEHPRHYLVCCGTHCTGSSVSKENTPALGQKLCHHLLLNGTYLQIKTEKHSQFSRHFKELHNALREVHTHTKKRKKHQRKGFPE